MCYHSCYSKKQLSNKQHSSITDLYPSVFCSIRHKSTKFSQSSSVNASSTFLTTEDINRITESSRLEDATWCREEQGSSAVVPELNAKPRSQGSVAELPRAPPPKAHVDRPGTILKTVHSLVLLFTECPVCLKDQDCSYPADYFSSGWAVGSSTTSL